MVHRKPAYLEQVRHLTTQFLFFSDEGFSNGTILLLLKKKKDIHVPQASGNFANTFHKLTHEFYS